MGANGCDFKGENNPKWPRIKGQRRDLDAGRTGDVVIVKWREL